MSHFPTIYIYINRERERERETTYKDANEAQSL